MLIAATIACGLACIVLVVAEYRLHALHTADATSSSDAARLATTRTLAKLIASALFVAIGARALGSGAFASWMFAGLVAGAIGDAALLGRGQRAFLAGLGAFLVGHLAYTIGIAQLVPPSDWLADAGWLAGAPIAVGTGALAVLWPRLGSMRGPVIVYVAAIVAMVVGAMAVAHGGALPEPNRCLLVIGAGLFFVSDLAVARDRFVARTFANKAWGLPAYYAGQLLIAHAIGGL